MKKNCNLVRKRWLLLSLFLVFTTSFSQRAYSQEMKLSFSLKNATLKDVSARSNVFHLMFYV